VALGARARALLAGAPSEDDASEPAREIAQRVEAADRAAAALGLGCALVPRGTRAPPAWILGKGIAACGHGEAWREPVCRDCRMGRRCPAGKRVLVPRAAGDWLEALARKADALSREIPAALRPWLLVPGG